MLKTGNNNDRNMFNCVPNVLEPKKKHHQTIKKIFSFQEMCEWPCYPHQTYRFIRSHLKDHFSSSCFNENTFYFEF